MNCTDAHLELIRLVGHDKFSPKICVWHLLVGLLHLSTHFDQQSALLLTALPTLL